MCHSIMVDVNSSKECEIHHGLHVHVNVSMRMHNICGRQHLFSTAWQSHGDHLSFVDLFGLKFLRQPEMHKWCWRRSRRAAASSRLWHATWMPSWFGVHKTLKGVQHYILPNIEISHVLGAVDLCGLKCCA